MYVCIKNYKKYQCCTYEKYGMHILHSEVKLHVKKYMCHKAAVGNSLMIRNGVFVR